MYRSLSTARAPSRGRPALRGAGGLRAASRCARRVAFLAAVLITACASRTAAEFVRTDFVLGTVCTLRLAQGGSEKVLDEAFARLRRVEAALSATREDSEISAVNAAAGRAPVKVGEDALAVIEKGLWYAAVSDGAFDPSVGPLVRLWGIGTEGERVPAAREIAEALSRVGWKDVILDRKAGTVFLKRPGMALDLGSATKGYVTDLLVALLESRGVRSAIIDLGGNIFAMGTKPDGSPWRIGLQNPESGKRGVYIGIAKLAGKTMVTSGSYERNFEADGRLYHHILDTRTGYPVENELSSVTIVADRSFDADGMTTTLFALGLEKGMELATARGIDVLMVTKDRKIHLSPGVSSYFEITDRSYKLGD